MSIKQRVPDEGKPTTRSTALPLHEVHDFGRSADRNNFEFHQIFPIVDPTLEEHEVFCLHNLPAGFEMVIDPARNVVQTFRHHSAFFTEPPINCGRVLEPLDHQVMHVSFAAETAASTVISVLRWFRRTL